MSLKLYNKEITQKNLKEELGKQSGHTATNVEDIGEGNLLVFFPCQRGYVVEKNGDVKYIGKEDEINEVYVIADKESDLNPKQVQAVKINVKRYNADESEKITIQYAWNQNKTDEPKSYKNATLEEGTTIAIVDSGEQPTGNYYLWVKVKAGNKEEIKRTYGEYYIQEYLTLVGTSTEYKAESGFLGNTDIQRGKIKNITITNSIEGKTAEDENCWDVGNKKQGLVLAWYEEKTSEDGETYYNVTIGQDGGVIANAYSNYLFAYIGNNLTETTTVTIEGLEYLDTSNVVSMNCVFYECSKLINLDVSKFNTSNVTSMHQMFYNCQGLESLNVSNFDTSNVTNMFRMFYNCQELESLDVSKFDTSNVTTMKQMFSECQGLEKLDVSNFDTSSVTNMLGIFGGCQGLKSLDVSKFNTSNVTDMGYMFQNCQGLESLDVSKFDTSNVTYDMTWMFYNCQGLTNLDVSKFDTSGVKTMQGMFYNCQGLTSLDVSNFDTSSVTTMQSMFYNCQGLTSLDVSNFDTSSVTNMREMFSNCQGLTSLDVSNFDTSSVTTMQSMFSNCQGLTSLDVRNFDTSKVTSMYNMFYNCKVLESLDLRNWIMAEEMYNSTNIFNGIPIDCNISVSTQEMKDWVKSIRSNLTNVNIVDDNGNVIESSEE